MTIDEYVQAVGISEVLHFTQPKGLLGFCFTCALIPRSQLAKEQLLEYIIKFNAARRTDHQWFDHSSLSINDINRRFFDASASWHQAANSVWWSILSFTPKVLSHPNVHFVATNNAYPAANPQPGLDGLRQLYESQVTHGFPSWAVHNPGTQSAPGAPSCPQAEALYPGRLSAEHLRRVYVRDAASYREACSYLIFLPNRSEIEVSIEPDRFSPFRVDPCRGY